MYRRVVLRSVPFAFAEGVILNSSSTTLAGTVWSSSWGRSPGFHLPAVMTPHLFSPTVLTGWLPCRSDSCLSMVCTGFSRRIANLQRHYSGMEAPTVLYIASGFVAILATRLARLHQMFKPSRDLAPPDGCGRAAIRERSWYRKTNEERISTEKALTQRHWKTARCVVANSEDGFRSPVCVRESSTAHGRFSGFQRAPAR